MPSYCYQGIVPVVDPTSYVHPLASLIGDVIVGPGCFIAPGASLRGDFGRILVEADSSIQDNVTVHSNSAHDMVIRRGAIIGHGAIVHGCEIGENSLIGMNAVILDEAVIGPENLVGALALVRSAMRTPARSLLLGNPARLVRTLKAEEITWRNDGLGDYQFLTRAALDDMIETEPLQEPELHRARIASNAVAVRLSV